MEELSDLLVVKGFVMHRLVTRSPILKKNQKRLSYPHWHITYLFEKSPALDYEPNVSFQPVLPTTFLEKQGYKSGTRRDGINAIDTMSNYEFPFLLDNAEIMFMNSPTDAVETTSETIGLDVLFNIQHPRFKEAIKAIEGYMSEKFTSLSYIAKQTGFIKRDLYKEDISRKTGLGFLFWKQFQWLFDIVDSYENGTELIAQSLGIAKFQRYEEVFPPEIYTGVVTDKNKERVTRLNQLVALANEKFQDTSNFSKFDVLDLVNETNDLIFGFGRYRFQLGVTTTQTECICPNSLD